MPYEGGISNITKKKPTKLLRMTLLVHACTRTQYSSILAFTLGELSYGWTMEGIVQIA